MNTYSIRMTITRREIRTLCLCVLTPLLVMCRLVFAEQTSYQDAALHCDQDVQADFTKLSGEYGHEVSILMDTFRLRGDLENTLAVKREKERFDSEKTLEEKNVAEVPVELKELQQKYLAAPRKDAKEIAKNAVVRLDDIKRKLTIDGKLDEAVLAQGEIDKILKKYGIVNPTKGSEIRSGALPKYIAMTVDLKIPTIVDGQTVGYMGLNSGEAYKLVKLDGNQATIRVGNSNVVVPADSTDLLQQIEHQQKSVSENVEEATVESINEPVDDTGNLNILKAFWGAENTWVDVTAKVRDMVARGESSINANGGVFGDPAPGHPKFLKITYALAGKQTTESTGEGASFRVPATQAGILRGAAPDGQGLGIIKATYGAGSQVTDITSQLQSMIVDDAVTAGRGWDVCHCDPAGGRVKKTIVTYVYGGHKKQKEFGEYEPIRLP